ncbi:wyosine [tRNA(Phe)-imidazoG37] synthetase, radical SAM superfamily [Campylobacter iguaniorum]|uniref:Wyosine [tRNA(Phe)-imidazoG37] synthetase, radical SAM superfamily n=1 Tax=Campylobacter iguaniorum TaxID=1244531 RepID=A0A076FEK9_9BACT|nr:radical SAM protein [Campylobacter iguaniorum]AII14279.1 wyosine [tRNA(Phe)-imidazoG37] synthetase, radical SAM superfamily [Campylobacter iguaniorum]ALV24014.1 wyosine [tRNA(Phe)-imidazoG37] synthetase, radical SAM superfamily [Campylobacter iguaniorum]
MSYPKKSYKYIFGPVSSRRFGSSLGIDLSPDKKCCNFDCLYCELAKAKVVNAIENPPLLSDIISELKLALSEFKNIDVITLTANGEPSLYPSLKELVSEVNCLKTTQKTLILSNGTSVLDADKFEAMLGLDIVKLSLDSAVQKTFRRIDRSLENIKIENLVEKMAEFRAKFRGLLVMEVLVVKGFNDTLEEFEALNLAFEIIKPDRIDISSIDRPPAHEASGIDDEILESLAKFITASPVVVARKKALNAKLEFSLDELRKLLKLRPQSKFDVEHNFAQSSKDALETLLQNKEASRVNLAGVEFYKII